MSSIDGVFSDTSGLKQSEIDEINKPFRELDLDNNGYITRDELKKCLKRADVIADDDLIHFVFKNMNWNHHHRVSYDEYLKFMSTIYRDEHDHLKRQSKNAGESAGSVA
ncbi:hypothetical protein I4U23_015893 [Adineta vaga]|nr:hypothetical protein I4U23_015893 [Adineta vaga]